MTTKGQVAPSRGAPRIAPASRLTSFGGYSRSVSSLRTSLRLSRFTNRSHSACHASAAISGCGQRFLRPSPSPPFLTRATPPLRPPQCAPCFIRHSAATSASNNAHGKTKLADGTRKSPTLLREHGCPEHDRTLTRQTVAQQAGQKRFFENSPLTNLKNMRYYTFLCREKAQSGPTGSLPRSGERQK